jgi:ATP-dependent Clp protease ATP-binding subunit ClpC
MSENAQTIMHLANVEAVALGRDSIGVEHLLLALAAQPTTVVARALACRGITRDVLYSAIRESAPPVATSERRGRLPATEETKQCIDLAIEEARMLGHSFIGPEHVLLGLLRTPNGSAVRVFNALGVSAESVRSAVMQQLVDQ